MWWRRTPGPKSLAVRAAVLALLWVPYVAAMVASRDRFDAILGPVVTLPLVATGVLVGWRGGLAVWIAYVLTHMLWESPAHILGDESLALLVGLALLVATGWAAETVQAERRQAAALVQQEHSLAESRAALLETQALAGVGSWVVDLRTGRREGTPEARRVLGLASDEPYTQEAVLGHAHPEDREPVRRSLEAALRDGEAAGDHRVVAPDGSVRWVHSVAQVRRGADGQPERLVGLSQDVTASRLALERLRQSEETYRRLVDNMPQPVVRYDLQLRRRFVNAAFADLSGRPADELLGRRPTEDQGQPSLASFEEALREVATAGVPRVVDVEKRAADGLRTFRVHAVPEWTGGPHPSGVLAIYNDVTELQRATNEARASEQALRAVLDSMDEMFVSTSLLGDRPPYVSRAAERIFGMPLEEFLREPMGWALRLHPDDQARSFQDYAKLLGGQAVHDRTRVVRPDGSTVWVESNLRGVKDAAGHTVRIDGSIRDVTAEVQAEASQRKVLELEAATAFKSQFLNMAAHELANPLTPVLLRLAGLRRHVDELPAAVRKDVEVLERNLTRFSTLVNDLLDAARLQAGRLRMAPRPIDLAPIVRDACATYAERAGERGIALDVVADPADAQGDPDRVTQVVLNLLSNALKFTPSGGQVRVRASGGKDGAVVEVADTGIGLTPDQQARLFQPFVQVHDQAMGVGGTGLGLYISRSIAQQMGGSLEVASAGPGHGATFTLRLPAKDPAPTATAAAAPPGSAEG